MVKCADIHAESLFEAVKCLEGFHEADLTKRIQQLENELAGITGAVASDFCSRNALNEVFDAACLIKRVAGQVNVIIHAAGIILSLPFILRRNEKIVSLSLGAGNTGKQFDLETDCQIAEFKFIYWQGGSETIRQNGLFKAFYELAEYDNPKRLRKCLYIVDDQYPLKFLNGRRAVSSVFDRYPDLLSGMEKRFDERFLTVRDYYLFRKEEVCIIALKRIVPALASR